MYPNLLNAKPLSPLILELEYDNGEKRKINMQPFCKSDFFKELENWDYFQQVEVKGDVVSWPNEQDLAPETLYLDSEKVN